MKGEEGEGSNEGGRKVRGVMKGKKGRGVVKGREGRGIMKVEGWEGSNEGAGRGGE